MSAKDVFIVVGACFLSFLLVFLFAGQIDWDYVWGHKSSELPDSETSTGIVASTQPTLEKHHNLVVIKNIFMIGGESESTQAEVQTVLKVEDDGSLITGLWKGPHLKSEMLSDCKYSYYEGGEKSVVTFKDVYRDSCEIVGGEAVESTKDKGLVIAPGIGHPTCPPKCDIYDDPDMEKQND